MKRWNAVLKRWNALTRNRLFDLAVGPVPLAISGGVWVIIGIAFVAVVVIATRLIIRAIRRQEDRDSGRAPGSSKKGATDAQAGEATNAQAKDGPADGGKA